MNEIKVPISGRDTLRRLGSQSRLVANSVRDTRNTINGVLNYFCLPTTLEETKLCNKFKSPMGAWGGGLTHRGVALFLFFFFFNTIYHPLAPVHLLLLLLLRTSLG
jgi:hypothetical protein